MTATKLYQLIYDKFGTVTRARGCFFYTKKCVRLTDMFQENGRAILGWDGKNSSTFLKNTLNKGLSGTFICEDKPRIDKAVSALVGKECHALFYSSKKEAVNAAVSKGAKNIVSYKPWNKEQEALTNADAVIIIPPFPWGENLFILAVSEPFEGQIKIPFALQAALTRSIYNLIAQLNTRTEKDWYIYDPILTKYWTRKGPYLFPKISENRYDAFVKHCLDCEIVINPSYNEPSIIPFGADRGVFTKLKNNPFDISQ
ncbi:MAG: hypothetical protein J6X78_04870 [Treponema sp.]|nr:hypothetical protein [Treponema sp.]